MKIGIILGIIVVLAATIFFVQQDKQADIPDPDITIPEEPAPEPVEPPTADIEPIPIVVTPPPAETVQPEPEPEPEPETIEPPKELEPEPEPEPEPPKVQYYTVEKGDTLSMISERYFGEARHWKIIYNANRQVIGNNPDVLREGIKLRIPRPEDLL